LKRLLFLAAVLLILAPLALLWGGAPAARPCACGAPAKAREAAPRVEILWDTYGVPHIFAADVESLFRAYGWAQMEAHGNLILRLYGQ
jgi:acyl-homoserine lactone acylase PvdQ